MRIHVVIPLGFLLAGCASIEPPEPKDNLIHVKVWPNQGTQYQFPERQTTDPLLYQPVTGKTGICFSGGGTRALSATAGQLRGLIASGLLKDVDYISCVSGGSWACTAFTYYRAGAANDAQFLGPAIEPEKITMENLNELDVHALGYTATADFKQPFIGDIFNSKAAVDTAWIRAVGQTFFESFGLYDPDNPSYFSLNKKTVNDIKTRNPSLAAAPFHIVRNKSGEVKRPYLVINSCVIWPVDDKKEENTVSFEYTPLYVGSAYNLTLTRPRAFKPALSREVGGGLYESFAMGSTAPANFDLPEGSAHVLEPGVPFTLVDASGASSSAFARALDRYTAVLSPHSNTWSIKDATPGETWFDAFGDGANVENYGLISLMRRELDRIVVFVNTPVKLDMAYDPGDGNSVLPPEDGQIDSNLPPFFGVSQTKKGKPDNPYPNNQVFSSSDYPAVVKGLQAARRSGGPVTVTTDLVTRENLWWGIPAGQKMKITWVYLDRTARWEDQLDPAIENEITNGNAAKPTGPFLRFPNYKTFGEDKGKLVSMTKPEVNLLGHLAYWTVMNSDEIRQTIQGTE